MNIVYDIREFEWNTHDNSFYADAPYLIPIEPAGYYHYAFPNEKKQFYIKNQDTGGYRRFRFISEFVRMNIGEDDFEPHSFWEFVSEDGILCRIGTSI